MKALDFTVAIALKVQPMGEPLRRVIFGATDKFPFVKKKCQEAGWTLEVLATFNDAYNLVTFARFLNSSGMMEETRRPYNTETDPLAFFDFMSQRGIYCESTARIGDRPPLPRRRK